MNESALSPEQVEEMLSVSLQTLNNPAFAGVFSVGGRNEAAIVGTLPNGVLVNGRVARLIVQADVVLIIDYKTDRPAPQQAEDIDIAYKVQMAAYQSVMQDLYPNRTVKCALLYTDGPHLLELDNQTLSESLNRVESRV